MEIIYLGIAMAYFLCFGAGVVVGVLISGLFVLIAIGKTHEEAKREK
ncbi:MAG: hypothetical protein GVY04_07960 [Cyanobacteria bacterium]|nr:hypothetical protein [Cyanobacteria bacterium GSL.Bin1]